MCDDFFGDVFYCCLFFFLFIYFMFFIFKKNFLYLVFISFVCSSVCSFDVFILFICFYFVIYHLVVNLSFLEIFIKKPMPFAFILSSRKDIGCAVSSRPFGLKHPYSAWLVS